VLFENENCVCFYDGRFGIMIPVVTNFSLFFIMLGPSRIPFLKRTGSDVRSAAMLFPKHWLYRFRLLGALFRLNALSKLKAIRRGKASLREMLFRRNAKTKHDTLPTNTYGRHGSKDSLDLLYPHHLRQLRTQLSVALAACAEQHPRYT